MSKNRIVLSIGTFLLLMPFLGFPSRWEFFFQIIFGIILILVSFSSAIKRRAAARKPRRKRELYNSIASESVAETTPVSEIITSEELPQETNQTQ